MPSLLSRRCRWLAPVVCADVLAVSLAVGGCHLGSPPRPPVLPTTTQAAPTRSAVPVPDEAELAEALLTAAEVPGSYTTSSLQTAPAAGLGGGIQDCGAAPGPAGRVVSSESVFQASIVGPFVVEVVSVMSVPQDAITKMQSLGTVATNCGHFGTTMPGGITIEIVVAELTFPRGLGDDLQAFQMTATLADAGVGLYAHVVTVRVANILVTITLMQMSPPDTATTQDILTRALDKVQRHLLSAVGGADAGANGQVIRSPATQ